MHIFDGYQTLIDSAYTVKCTSLLKRVIESITYKMIVFLDSYIKVQSYSPYF